MQRRMPGSAPSRLSVGLRCDTIRHSLQCFGGERVCLLCLTVYSYPHVSFSYLEQRYCLAEVEGGGANYHPIVLSCTTIDGINASPWGAMNENERCKCE